MYMDIVCYESCVMPHKETGGHPHNYMHALRVWEGGEGRIKLIFCCFLCTFFVLICVRFDLCNSSCGVCGAVMI